MIWGNQGSMSKFIEGLGIEIFILALFALSFDLLFGITGLLSFGHAMFFAWQLSDGYCTEDSFPCLLGSCLVGFAGGDCSRLLFSLVLPRVKVLPLPW